MSYYRHNDTEGTKCRSPSSDRSSRRKRVEKREHHDRKHSRRRRSSTTSSDEKEFDKMLDRKRLEKILREKEEKRRLKEIETPDEKRARRLAKKLQKEERRRTETMNAFPEGIPYTDLNNPFNDTNLTETFIWKKKWEAEGRPNISIKKAEKVNREIIAKNFAEMEQLKRNREARDAAREDMEMIARDQERRQCDWSRTEDVFHLRQAKLRSSIRIKEGRAKPIDYLARYISYADEANNGAAFELNNPLTFLPKDSIDDFEDLIADIQVYRLIDGQKNKSYWDDIETVAKNELKRLLETRKRSTDTGTVHSSVQEEVNKIFKGKNYDELEQLESQITARISNASRGTDVSYWESLLDSLRPFMAKQRLKELHTKMAKLRLKNIRQEQMNQMDKSEDFYRVEEEKAGKDSGEGDEKPTEAEFGTKTEQRTQQAKTKYDDRQTVEEAKTFPFTIEEFFVADDEQREQMHLQLEAREVSEQFATVLYECGRYSPAYGSVLHTMPGIEILDETEDDKRLSEIRFAPHKKDGTENLTAKDKRMLEIARQGMDQDEAEFSVEEKLEKQNFLWSDKYRPRKPRYFNRVHTGFDWNKYNQTHYDIDNPPPKIVQGYRFNIFYPDLLDPTQTPTFTLIKCEDPDFSILRFCAGPPYEDIAFKIVNREWEVNYKHGYKCQFQNGIFQLWFFFKRYRYRR